jgi:hypothetical protein
MAGSRFNHRLCSAGPMSPKATAVTSAEPQATSESAMAQFLSEKIKNRASKLGACDGAADFFPSPWRRDLAR